MSNSKIMCCSSSNECLLPACGFPYVITSLTCWDRPVLSLGYPGEGLRVQSQLDPLLRWPHSNLACLLFHCKNVNKKPRRFDVVMPASSCELLCQFSPIAPLKGLI